jgi:hypothetical protein
MKKMLFVILIILTTLLLSAAGLFLWYKSRLSAEILTYDTLPEDTILANPYIGFAPTADYEELAEKYELVYAGITWAELEPEQGVYDFAGIEEAYHLERWKAEGKHLVLRFVLDDPGREKHLDIPQWLYDLTGDGTYYDHEYGAGYCPNYENETLIALHAKALQALAEEYTADGFLVYVQLGSLGHWGEWHILLGEGEDTHDTFPNWDVCQKYVDAYKEAFPGVQLLMRRTFPPVSEDGFGTYNDMTGEPEDTEEWLEWISEGGVYPYAAEHFDLPAAPEIWRRAAVGGEFTSAISMEDMLGRHLKRTLRLLEESHMSFIGPKIPDDDVMEDDASDRLIEAAAEAVPQILRRVGYRYTVTKGTFARDDVKCEIAADVTLKNIGVAPLYRELPVCLYLLNPEGEVVTCIEQETDLRALCEGEESTLHALFQIPAEKAEEMIGYRIAIGIKREDAGAKAGESAAAEGGFLLLDLDTELCGGRNVLYTVEDKD